jgi:hypothetical protein
LLIPKSSRLKKIKELRSKNFQEQRGANRGVSKLLRNKEEQTEVFQNFSGAKGEQAKTFQAFQE